MAQITLQALTTNHAGSRRTATAWIGGGGLWLVAGLLHADSGWRFDSAAVVWIVADVLLAAGLLGLFVLRPHGVSRVGTIALAVALAGRAAFTAGEVFSIIDGNDEGPLIPVGAMLTAISMTIYGIVVLRRGGGARPGRWSYLTMGLYPFVAMFPVLAITGEPPAALIAGWGVPAALIGVATLPPSESNTPRMKPSNS